jgi:hypothetical protein
MTKDEWKNFALFGYITSEYARLDIIVSKIIEILTKDDSKVTDYGSCALNTFKNLATFLNRISKERPEWERLNRLYLNIEQLPLKRDMLLSGEWNCFAGEKEPYFTRAYKLMSMWAEGDAILVKYDKSDKVTYSQLAKTAEQISGCIAEAREILIHLPQ